MAEYIELEKAKRFFENIDAGRVGCSTLLTPTEFAEYLDEIEPADVALIRQGYWKQARYTEAPLYICSECDKPEYKQHNYCPNCGAKMGGDGNA